MAENNHQVDTYCRTHMEMKLVPEGTVRKLELCFPVLHSPDQLKGNSTKPASKPIFANLIPGNHLLLKFMDRMGGAAARFLLENSLLE